LKRSWRSAGWSRGQAIDYMVGTSGVAQGDMLVDEWIARVRSAP
jgi:hypothetical protein